jgi:hypothetical protein
MGWLVPSAGSQTFVGTGCFSRERQSLQDPEAGMGKCKEDTNGHLDYHGQTMLLENIDKK